MNDDYFRIMAEGLHGELARLSPDEVRIHFENYRHCFLLDRSLTVCYLNRFLAAFNTEHAPGARAPLEYLLAKCLQFTPFDIANMASPWTIYISTRWARWTPSSTRCAPSTWPTPREPRASWPRP